MASTGKHILLGISGGIAAYKAAELVRLLRAANAEVRVVMTAAAIQFIQPLTFQALSGHPVHIELLDSETENAMGHIHLARWADVLLIAPATANFIAKCSHGLADDLLSTLYLAANCPIYFAPSMNQAMWQKAVVRENVLKLRGHGVLMIGPETGHQACGETGPGRMADPQDICAFLDNQCFGGEQSEPCLRGLKVLISAGPTREPLDPVRYLSNRSSGKMGYALAQAAADAGAEVTLVSGPVALPPPPTVSVIAVTTAADMYAVVLPLASINDVYIGAAAVADYTPALVEAEKIKKHAASMVLTLHKTKDILAAVSALPTRPFTVGFAAETHELESYAHGKLVQKNLDMIAANWVGGEAGGFEDDMNALQVFWRNGEEIKQHAFPMTDKKNLARQLIDLIAKLNQQGKINRG
jgi:phosphopantothenoylcysteine decarboxylase/phosphopantothenate--cysteine ligase